MGNRYSKALAWEAPPAFRERYDGHEAGGSRGLWQRTNKRSQMRGWEVVAPS
jgi:hypothetical protein